MAARICPPGLITTRNDSSWRSHVIKIDLTFRTAGDGGATIPTEISRVGRDARLTVRLRADDQLLLRERASARGMPTATYVSVLVRSHLRGLTRLTHEELLALKEAVAELAAIGRNLNRIETVIIDRRYNGPDASGNGGWVAGSLARRFGAMSVSVTLRAPVPLAVPLCIRWQDDGTATLDNDGTLIAEATATPLELDVPIAPDPAEAEAAGVLAQQVSAQRGENFPYAHCFGCGFARSDGLRIVPGPVGNEGIVATTWTPSSLEGDAGGQLTVEATWALPWIVRAASPGSIGRAEQDHFHRTDDRHD